MTSSKQNLEMMQQKEIGSWVYLHIKSCSYTSIWVKQKHYMNSEYFGLILKIFWIRFYLPIAKNILICTSKLIVSNLSFHNIPGLNFLDYAIDLFHGMTFSTSLDWIQHFIISNTSKANKNFTLTRSSLSIPTGKLS